MILCKRFTGAKTYGLQTFTYDSMRRITTESDDNHNTLSVQCDYTYDKLHRKLTETKTVVSATTKTTQCFVDAFE